MKELEVYAAVVVLNDLNLLHVLHVAFAFTKVIDHSISNS